MNLFGSAGGAASNLKQDVDGNEPSKITSDPADDPTDLLYLTRRLEEISKNYQHVLKKRGTVEFYHAIMKQTSLPSAVNAARAAQLDHSQQSANAQNQRPLYMDIDRRNEILLPSVSPSAYRGTIPSAVLPPETIPLDPEESQNKFFSYQNKGQNLNRVLNPRLPNPSTNGGQGNPVAPPHDFLLRKKGLDAIFDDIKRGVRNVELRQENEFQGANEKLQDMELEALRAGGADVHATACLQEQQGVLAHQRKELMELKRDVEMIRSTQMFEASHAKEVYLAKMADGKATEKDMMLYKRVKHIIDELTDPKNREAQMKHIAQRYKLNIAGMENDLTTQLIATMDSAYLNEDGTANWKHVERNADLAHDLDDFLQRFGYNKKNDLSKRPLMSSMSPEQRNAMSQVQPSQVKMRAEQWEAQGAPSFAELVSRQRKLNESGQNEAAIVVSEIEERDPVLWKERLKQVEEQAQWRRQVRARVEEGIIPENHLLATTKTLFPNDEPNAFEQIAARHEPFTKSSPMNRIKNMFPTKSFANNNNSEEQRSANKPNAVATGGSWLSAYLTGGATVKEPRKSTSLNQKASTLNGVSNSNNNASPYNFVTTTEASGAINYSNNNANSNHSNMNADDTGASVRSNVNNFISSYLYPGAHTTEVTESEAPTTANERLSTFVAATANQARLSSHYGMTNQNSTNDGGNNEDQQVDGSSWMGMMASVANNLAVGLVPESPSVKNSHHKSKSNHKERRRLQIVDAELNDDIFFANANINASHTDSNRLNKDQQNFEKNDVMSNEVFDRQSLLQSQSVVEKSLSDYSPVNQLQATRPITAEAGGHLSASLPRDTLPLPTMIPDSGMTVNNTILENPFHAMEGGRSNSMLYKSNSSVGSVRGGTGALSAPQVVSYGFYTPVKNELSYSRDLEGESPTGHARVRSVSRRSNNVQLTNNYGNNEKNVMYENENSFLSLLMNRFCPPFAIEASRQSSFLCPPVIDRETLAAPDIVFDDLRAKEAETLMQQSVPSPELFKCLYELSIACGEEYVRTHPRAFAFARSIASVALLFPRHNVALKAAVYAVANLSKGNPSADSFAVFGYPIALLALCSDDMHTALEGVYALARFSASGRVFPFSVAAEAIAQFVGRVTTLSFDQSARAADACLESLIIFVENGVSLEIALGVALFCLDRFSRQGSVVLSALLLIDRLGQRAEAEWRSGMHAQSEIKTEVGSQKSKQRVQEQSSMFSNLFWTKSQTNNNNDMDHMTNTINTNSIKKPSRFGVADLSMEQDLTTTTSSNDFVTLKQLQEKCVFPVDSFFGFEQCVQAPLWFSFSLHAKQSPLNTFVGQSNLYQQLSFLLDLYHHDRGIVGACCKAAASLAASCVPMARAFLLAGHVTATNTLPCLIVNATKAFPTSESTLFAVGRFATLAAVIGKIDKSNEALLNLGPEALPVLVNGISERKQKNFLSNATLLQVLSGLNAWTGSLLAAQEDRITVAFLVTFVDATLHSLASGSLSVAAAATRLVARFCVRETLRARLASVSAVRLPLTLLNNDALVNDCDAIAGAARCLSLLVYCEEDALHDAVNLQSARTLHTSLNNVVELYRTKKIVLVVLLSTACSLFQAMNNLLILQEHRNSFVALDTAMVINQLLLLCENELSSTHEAHSTTFLQSSERTDPVDLFKELLAQSAKFAGALVHSSQPSVKEVHGRITFLTQSFIENPLHLQLIMNFLQAKEETFMPLNAKILK